MRSFLRTIPIIGSLLISAAPVKAFETFEELDNACNASEENSNLCEGVAELGAGFMPAAMLCDLEANGRLTKENVVMTWDEWYEVRGPSPLFDDAVEMALKQSFPECSIKPIP